MSAANQYEVGRCDGVAQNCARGLLNVGVTDIQVVWYAVSNVTLPHRYGNSRAIWDHTVLPATRQR